VSWRAAHVEGQRPEWHSLPARPLARRRREERRAGLGVVRALCAGGAAA
jgi:hypothetical protein